MKLDFKKNLKIPEKLKPNQTKTIKPNPNQTRTIPQTTKQLFFCFIPWENNSNFRRTIKNYLLDITSNRCIYALRNIPFKTWNLSLKSSYTSAIRHETKKLFSLGLVMEPFFRVSYSFLLHDEKWVWHRVHVHLCSGCRSGDAQHQLGARAPLSLLPFNSVSLG